MSRITVIGADYVGLVTAAGLAHLGHPVAVLETDRQRLARLRAGHLPIHEPGLAEMVADAVAAGRLEFGDNYAAVIPSSDFVLLAVHTPARADGSADTSFVLGAVEMLLEFARPGLVIVTKSTVPVGTGDQIEYLVGRAGLQRVDVASNPEFLREGSAVDDFLRPDRVVVGAHAPEIGRHVASIYAALHAPVLLTTRRSAELAKYAANAALATRISFMNEIATISEAVGADVEEIARIVGSDSRIGPKFLQAGLGWGGSCFPKDLSALAATAHEQGRRMPILTAVMDVNARQRTHAFDVLVGATRAAPDPTIAVLGLTFKPDTDDMRGSPALDVIGRLLEEGIAVSAHDPQGMAHASLLLPNVRYAPSAYEAAAGADALLRATEWPEYLQLDWLRIRRAMRGALVLDGRNVLHGGVLAAMGFDYRSFGRPAPIPPRAPGPSRRALRPATDPGPVASKVPGTRRAANPVS